MNKKIIILLLSLISLTSLFSEGTKEIAISNTIEFTDSYNRTVQISKNPQRIVSLGPNITEIVSELDFDKLVGRTDYCDYPEKVSSVKSIGSITNANIEEIIELEPDLVIGSVHCPKDLLENLTKLGICSIAIYDDNSLDGSYNIISKIGYVMNEEEKANEIIKNNKALVDQIVDKTSTLDKKTVYYALSFGEWGDFTAGGSTFIGKMINLAGAINIAEDVDGWNYSVEQLIEKDPQIIIVSKYYNSKDQFINTWPYSSLTAVKENRVYEIDNNLLDRQGIRNAQGLLELAKIIHPNEFK
ncbi:MAG: ABC transporter substrate-binding protein [Sphaerochaetaceae bacterium]|nr:ABC transporter substrate-binding protein [Sphaerochaetaceae bacterium]